MSRVLLLGKSGQVGWELQRSLAVLGDVIALDRSGAAGSDYGAAGDLCGDLARPDDLAATVRAVRPDVIVNAAAYTMVDRAESEPDLAHLVNAVAPGVLGRVSAELDACLVHYSTDYVFDGSGSRPWGEDDTKGPLNAYGRTKLEGEQRIRASGCRHLILRTSWVYALRGGNFAKTMLRLAAERDVLAVIDDQFGAPTGAELLADATAHALRTVDRERGTEGTYHVTARGETNWFEYARFVIDGARARGWPVKAPPDGVRPVASSTFPLAARRPLNSRLDCTRFRDTFCLELPPWERGVERLLDELTPPDLQPSTRNA